jgi:hypothetical protein
MNASHVKKAMIAAANDFLAVTTSVDTSTGTVSDLPVMATTSISWENRTFDQPASGIWSSVFYVPNIPEGRTVGVGGIDEINGFMQIDLNVATDDGDADLMEWEDKARLYFTSGRSFSYSAQNVLVLSAGLDQGRIVENNFRKSLTVAFKSSLKRHILT